MKAKFIIAMLVLVGVTLNCNFGNQTATPPSAITQPTEESNQSATALPDATSAPLPTATSEATVTATPVVITGDDPIILNEFLLDKKYFGFSRIASAADRLWITTISGHLLVYDTNGQMLKEIQLAEKPGHYLKGWLAYDNKYVWAMIRTTEGRDDQGLAYLFRVGVEDFAVLPVDLPEMIEDLTGGTINPFWMGFATKPGELWVGGIHHVLVYDTETLQVVKDIRDGWFVHGLLWDGKYMWAGYACGEHEYLAAVDPDYVSERDCSRPSVLVDVDWMFSHKNIIWVGSIDELFGYNREAVAGSTEDNPAFPEVELPFREEHNLFINPTYDGRYVWDLDLGWGDIYSYDPDADMQEVGLFSFMKDGEDGAVFDIAFDGHFLWGLKFTDDAEYHLVQVGLPWAQ